MKFIISILLLFILSSCIEIIDDITINNDGSGTFKYSINLSQSKVKVNSYLALDSINGQKAMKLPDLKNKVLIFKNNLKSQTGISNVTISENYEDYIIKIQCDFDNLTNLQKGIQKSISLTLGGQETTYEWISFNNDIFFRSVPDMTNRISDKLKIDYTKLNEGSYTSITRFKKLIDKCENDSSVVSKSGTAVMLKTTPKNIIENIHILDNKITLKQN
jgi:hypothetical protein